MSVITQTWLVRNAGPGRVERYCSRCNTPTSFVSSRKFRTNANGKLVDVWLIYNCSRCSKSWNMAVEQRRRISVISPALLQLYFQNDAELADRIGISDATIEYTVRRLVHFNVQPVRVRIDLTAGIKLRTDRFFAAELGFSRSALVKMIELGRIRSHGSCAKIWKRSLLDRQIFEIEASPIVEK